MGRRNVFVERRRSPKQIGNWFLTAAVSRNGLGKGLSAESVKNVLATCLDFVWT